MVYPQLYGLLNSISNSKQSTPIPDTSIANLYLAFQQIAIYDSESIVNSVNDLLEPVHSPLHVIFTGDHASFYTFKECWPIEARYSPIACQQVLDAGMVYF